MGIAQQINYRAVDPAIINGLQHTYFCNVYLDQDGEHHYSTEDFKVGEEAITSYEAALEAAVHRCILGDEYGEKWSLVCVMTSGKPVTSQMREELAVLEGFSKVMRDSGVNPENVPVEQWEAEAKELLWEDRRI